MNKTYSHPGTEAPTRNYTCLNCGTHHTIKGQWNIHAGRWLMAFNCPQCDLHQEAFVTPVRYQLERPTPKAD